MRVKEFSVADGGGGAGSADRASETRLSDELVLLRLFAHLHGVTLESESLVRRLAGQALDASLLVDVLHSAGLEATAESGSLQSMVRGALPVLALSRSGAWVIVGATSDRRIAVQDAGADQPHSPEMADFEASWSGQWIQARRVPTVAEQNDPDGRRFGIGWFRVALGRHKALMGEVMLASLFIQVFALLTPLIFQVVIDKVLTHRSLSTLDVMVIALLGLSVFEVVLGAMRHYVFSHTTSRIDLDLGVRLFGHLMRLPLGYFESRRSGDTVARVKELDNARNFMTGQALSTWLDLLFAVLFLAVMFHYSATLSFIVLAALPVFFGASWLVQPLLRGKLEDKFALGAENQAFLVETVGAMETLKSQAVELQWQREWERRLAEYVQASFHSGHLAAATQQVIGLASKLLTVVLLYVGARLAIQGELTVGALIAFNMLAGRVNAPILKLASFWQDFAQMKVSVMRLGDIMNAPAEPAFNATRSAPPPLVGRVSFEGVSFRYGPGRPDVLADFSVEVNAGEVVGIVGVSGAGKTTFVRLLQRLHVPQRGRVLLDGMDLSLVDTSWLRRQIGVVGQDTMLFNRSVRDNIALSCPDMAMERIVDVAALAGAHDFILELPEGYDTVIGERGSRLSGGQRARLAIARALAMNPRLLVLDEATAALDHESERLIHDNMTRICRGRTVFIVAHRMSTLRLADRILVMEKGRLIESGSHAQLMARPGRYAALHGALHGELPVMPARA